MIAQRLIRGFAVGCATVFIAACGGGPNTPAGSVVGVPGGPDPPPTQLVPVKLTVTISGGESHGMRPSYISKNTQSVTVQLASVNGGGVSGVNASIVNTTPKSPNCKPQGGALSCTATISGSPGSDVFSVTTYDGLNATGSVLSAGTASAKIGSGGGGLPISNALSIDINGLIATLSLSVSPNKVKRGTPIDAAVTLKAFDASGAEIVGGSDYQTPITLGIQGDTTGSFALHAAGKSGPTLSIVKPTGNITLSYDGNKQASSVTITASAAGTGGKNAPFALEGHKPPPPPGTIYALNLGSASGQGATVTEYDGTANGNVAPLRTLNLSSKLYARSISVDSAGNLYVGFLDSPAGFSPSGTPDGGNLVAIYAPGANGNDPPTATLVADPSTSTLLFPLFSTINGSSGLVTYGATTVDKNTGDAILTYTKGASGKTSPQYGLDFSTPIAYSGPTGLTLDAAGNVYYIGSLHGLLGPQFGIYVAAAADIGNPAANPTRTIPYDQHTGLTPYETTNVGLDASGEIVAASNLVTFQGSTASCQGQASVFAAGTSGGTTDNPPLRVLTLSGVFTQNQGCNSFSNPLEPFFPEIALYGSTLFVADDFNNAINAFPSGSGGTVKPTHRIAGAATGLSAPIAVFVAKTSSGPAVAGPVRNGRTSPPSASCARSTCALTRSIRIP